MARAEDPGELSARQRWTKYGFGLVILGAAFVGQALLFNQHQLSPSASWAIYGAGLLIVIGLSWLYRRTLGPGQARQERMRYYRNVLRAMPLRYGVLAVLLVAVLTLGLTHGAWILVVLAISAGILLGLLYLWQRRWTTRRLSR